MKIILVTAKDLEHMYVANKLAAQLSLDGIIVDHGRQTSIAATALRLCRKYKPAQLASRLHVDLMRRLWRDVTISRHSVMEVFGPENCLQFSRPSLLHHIRGINSSDGIQAVSALKPDVLLIYGTVLVGQRILSLTRNIALNMHTGLAPYYRGADCAFWPIYNQELHMIGATVHECTRVIDGGKIFGTAKAHLYLDDDIFSIFARSVVAGADLYVRIVPELIAGRLNGIEQDLSLGREYRALMRDVRAERAVRKLIQEGVVRRYIESPQYKLVNAAAAGEPHVMPSAKE